MKRVTAAALSSISVFACHQGAFAATGAPSGWAKEPTKVLGLALHAPLLAQADLSECPRVRGRTGVEQRDESFRGFCYEKPAEFEKYTSWPTFNPPRLASYDYSLHIVVREGILHGFEFSVPRKQSDSFLQTLVERYGPPSGMTKAALQNGFGATVGGRTFNWNGRKVTMSYVEYGDGLEASATFILTNAFMDAVDAQRARQRKEAGEKL